MRQSVPDSSSPILRMPRETAYPAASRDFEELVWENGTLLMRRPRDRVKSGDAMPSSWLCSGFLDNNREGFEGNSKAGNERSMFVLDSNGETSKPNNDNSQEHQAPTSFLRSVSDSNLSLFSPNSSRSLGGINKGNFSHFLGLYHPLTNDANIAKGHGSSISGFDALLKPKTEKLAKIPSLEDKNMTCPQKQLDQVEMLDPGNEVVKAHSSSRFGGGDSLVPDEQSQAIGNHFIDDHDTRDHTIGDDHLVPSPDTSLEDSAVQRKFKRRRFQESESSYLDEDEGEEMEECKRRSVHYSGGNAGTKRNRFSTHHNLSEKKRRERINKRMRALQVLLPNCNKLDKASVLDEAIEYMKTLQLQLQMLSTGTRMLAPPMTMLPTGMHQMMPYLNQFPPGFTGMGMRMGPAFAQGLGHQFPIPGTIPANLAGGFQPMGCMPYINAHIGDHSALRSLLTSADFYSAGTSNNTTNNLPGSSVLSGSNETNQCNGFSETGDRSGR